jgi:predicted O-linked N-acetylglucosamine transferase (SPINDLY family)
MTVDPAEDWLSIGSDDLEARLAAARSAAEGGDSILAERLYRAMVDAGEKDVRPYCNLGVLALLEQRADAALAWLEQAVLVDPNHARSHLNLGMALQLAKRTAEAIPILQRAVSLDPQLAEAWNNLGYVLAEDDQPEAAMAAYQRALDLRPGYGVAAQNLSVLLANHGNPLAGEQLLRQLPATVVQEPGVLFHLGEMLRLQGKLEEAQVAYAESLEQAPEDAEQRMGVGLALLGAGQADQALTVLMPLLAMRPDDAASLVAMGVCLQALGDVIQAMDLYQRAIAIDPINIRARNLLGICYSSQGLHADAIREFRAGLEQEPTDLELRCNLAGSLRSQGFLQASMAEIEQLLRDQPECRDALAIQLFSCSIGSQRLAPLAHELTQTFWTLTRSRSKNLVHAPALAIATPTPPTSTSTLPLKLGRLPSLQLPEMPCDQRLRIGFLSAEIGDHVVASFLFSFLNHYDRERFAVELFAASRRFDARASEMVQLADHHWLLDGMEVGRARELIRSRQLNILVETSGFTADSAIELLAERCAPVQCHYIGYHATTGLDTIDWFIGDDETVPEAFASQFVEGLWRLPRPWLAREPDPSLPPAGNASRDPVAVLGSFNQLAKVRDETLDYWAAALNAVPSSQLVLKDRSAADRETRERIVGALASHDVAPERISFLAYVGSWEEHMATYNQLDVALDTTPWSSATTGFDALAMGVPLVAIRGGCTAARMSASILKGLGRPEWVAETPGQFASIVAGLCADLPALRASKQALRHQVLASPLFNGVDLSRRLEQAFLAMQTIASASVGSISNKKPPGANPGGFQLG